MSTSTPSPPIDKPVPLPTNENDPEILKIRHSASHVMAAAVQKLHPDAQVTIGPWIDNGFYYDFYMKDGAVLKEEDFKAIKKEVRRGDPN